MEVKKFLNFILEFLIFIFALGVFCYSGYKIASYYHLIPQRVSANDYSCADCSPCFYSGWKSDFCQKLKEWCEKKHPPCWPSPTPQLTPTQTPVPTQIPPTPTVSPTSTPFPTTTPISPSPTGTVVTPTPTSTPSPSGGQVGGVSQPSEGGGQAFPCVPPPAPAIPTLLSAIPVSSTEIKLAWTKVERATHYVVAYGESSGKYSFGNPNVGDSDTYLVGNLQPAKTYFFVVSAAIGGDCPVASPFSNELSARTLSFSTLVAGAKTSATPIPPEGKPTEGEIGEGISTQAGEVAGAQKGPCPFWWISLLGQTILLTAFYLYLLVRHQHPRFWWLPAPVLVVLGYLLDWYAHTHWYTPSSMCPWEKWLGIVLAAGETVGYQVSRSKTPKTAKK